MDIHSPGAEEILALSAKHKKFTADALANPSLERRKEHRRTARYTSCERKISYTHTAATRAARQLGRRTDSLVQAYHCKNCGYWHVGHFIKDKT